MQDLRTFSASDRLFLVQASYGKAMLQAHSLERSLGALLICHVTFHPERAALLNSEITKIKKLPLGPLIHAFESAFSPDDDLKEELRNLLFLRNELAHRISDTIINATVRVDWEQRVVVELEEICSYFVEVRALLRPYLEVFWDKMGISEARLLELAHTIYPGAAVSGGKPVTQADSRRQAR